LPNRSCDGGRPRGRKDIRSKSGKRKGKIAHAKGARDIEKKINARPSLEKVRMNMRPSLWHIRSPGERGHSIPRGKGGRPEGDA